MSSTSSAFSAQGTAERNQGLPLDLALVDHLRINRTAVERRAGTLMTRRSVKKDWQAAWLLKAITLIDLTTLSGDDSEDRVARLCRKARHPVSPQILADFNMPPARIHTGAVCVYHEMIPAAVAALEGSGIPVAAVSTGFPAGLSPFKLRVAEIEESVAAGATEIDVVISRRHVLRGDWQALYDEVQQFREACGEAHLKVILATGQLGSLTQIAKASMVAMMAGADFIKTSTGMEPVNATLPVSLVMVRMIRDYVRLSGYRVGFKPAGGINTAKQALSFMVLMREELGRDWLEPELFRLGASRLLTDIERQLSHQASGAYAARHHQAIG